LEKAIELCRVSMKRGSINRDEISLLRSSVTPCHRYFEKNTHGVFEKIVIDCWIEYICRQNEINPPTLWNSFSGCANDFERTLFSRLCEFRYNQAINQWNNILRIQEYAVKKTDFIFAKKLENHAQAVAKAGYFDLLFNVAANEMGCGELSTNKVYSSLRTPNSPFVMSGVSREIVRNVLAGLNYDSAGDNPEGFTANSSAANPAYTADKPAMDAFAAIKNAIPEDADAIIMKSIPRIAGRVYIPESFKAMIDLEIDSLIESGAVIQKCGRCLGYFLKDEDYDHDYCSERSEPSARTCLDIMGEKMAAARSSLSPVDVSLLYSRCDQLYKEMAERVNVDMNQRDFSDWYKGLVLIRENVLAGEATVDDFENFAEYSRAISFAPKAKRKPVKVDSEPRAFEFERVGKPNKVDSANPLSTKTVATPKTPEEDVVTLADLYGIDITDIPDIAPEPLQQPPEWVTLYSQMQQMQQTTSAIPAPATTRIIRGVVPDGVRELPKPVYVEPPLPPAPPLSEEPQRVEADSADSSDDSATFASVRELELDSLPMQFELPKLPEVSDLSDPQGFFELSPFPKLQEAQPTLPPAEVFAPPPESKPKPKPKSMLKLPEPSPKPKPLLKIPEPSAKSKSSAKSEVSAKPKLLELPPVKQDGLTVNPNGFTPPEPPSELDFGSILSGIQRNDSFEMPLSEATKPGQPAKVESGSETQTSHKTKRVMDAIFGKSKIVNPLVKASDEEG
jgi:hypothetical protein